MNRPLALLWYRNDLRLADNPALLAALSHHNVLPVHIHSPEEEGAAAPGAASRWWLHHSLSALAKALEARGSRLIIRRGPTLANLQALCEQTGARAVFWNRRYDPSGKLRDEQVRSRLKTAGIETHSFNATLLVEPETLSTGAGTPYTVFTPFWRACMARKPPPEPTAAPRRIGAPESWPESLQLDALALQPRVNWAAGLARTWQPGEAGGTSNLERFIDEGLNEYEDARDRPDLPGSSLLSPHLHFGEVSPRQAFYAAERASEQADNAIKPAVSAYQRELGWREFAYHLLWHFPHTVAQPLNPAFQHFPWARDNQALKAWQRAQTGYPLVDAGMRQLWQTGFVHNRVRMVVASFLVKHLLLPWQSGAAWFWDTLVDADLANNTLGWQWIAGCGADAAPFFRIFNPVLQAQKFDPRGVYVRHWIPELAKLSDKYLHRPWEAPATELAKAGVVLGKTYPRPIVDHTFARQRALQALAETKHGGRHREEEGST